MNSEPQQVALVTGAGRGIGRAIALAFAKTGCHVIVNCINRLDKAQETLDCIKGEGGSAEICRFDVADTAATADAIESLLARLGKIDILINNAGIRRDTLFVWMKSEEWQSILDVNLSGFFNTTRPVIQSMVMNRFGRIINITSVSGQIGTEGQVNYSAAKSGLIGATKALAREVAKRNITVNAVSPGFIDTEMLAGLPIKEIVKNVPMRRLGTVEEVADLAVFLCSPQASYITGQVIGVNGGIC